MTNHDRNATGRPVSEGCVSSVCDGSCLKSAVLFLAARRPIDQERREPNLDSTESIYFEFMSKSRSS